MSNKAEYDKSVSDLTIINNYISFRTCEVNGQINNLGKNNFEISACQRKITLRDNKKTFVDGYLACQDSVNAGPKILSGTLTNATLIEQGDNEATHPNESVYELSLRSQGESYVRELVYELTLPLINNDVGVTITKVELKSAKTGTYACAQSLAPTQTDTTKKVFLITCRAVDGGYQMGINGDTSQFSTSLKFWVSTIAATGEGTLKFLSGKYSIASVGGTEKPLTRINGVTTGTLKYTAALVDPRDLTVELDTLTDTSSTNIPVQAKFNKLINRSTISMNDFVISDNASASNLACTNAPDADNNLRTICTIDLEPNETTGTSNITVDFPAAKVKDYTR